MVLSEISKFLYFIIVGGIIGLLFDVFRILRRCFKTSDIITYIHDILFLLTSGLILLFSIFIINNGEIRGFMFLGITIGLIIYLLVLSKHIINISTKFLLFIKKIILRPIRKIFNIIKKIVVKIKNIIVKKLYKKIKIRIKERKNKIFKEKETKNLTNFNK